MARTNSIFLKEKEVIEKLIDKVVEKKLKDYILIPKSKYFIDRQGYKYIFTGKSFLLLNADFEKNLHQGQKEIENGEILQHKEFWDNLGV